MNTFSRHQNRIAFIFMTIAASSIALSSFFAKLCILNGFSQQLTVLARFTIPFVMLVSFFLKIKYLPRFYWFNIQLQIIRAFALTFSQISLFYAIKKLPLSEAMILYSTGPIFILLYDLISEKNTALTTVISLSLGIFGVGLMLQLEASVINGYVWIGLLSGFFLSISQILLHKASKKIHSFDILFYVYLFSVLISIISVYILGWNSTINKANWTYLSSLFLIFTGIFSLGNQYFRGKAYSMVTVPSYLSPLMYVSILVSVILDGVYFNSLPNIKVWSGGLLIVLGAYLASKK